MNNKFAKLKERFSKLGPRLLGLVSNHRLTIMIVIFGLVVGLALFRARAYTNPARDEATYEQKLAEQKSITIDAELVEKIKASIDDEDASITENTAPGRTNPFNE